MNLSIFVLLTICEIFLNLNVIRILQLNSYRMVINKKSLAIFWWQLLLFVLSSIGYVFAYIKDYLLFYPYFIQICIMLIALLIINIYKRQKLAFTKRAIRLITLTIITVFTTNYLIYTFIPFMMAITILTSMGCAILSSLINSPIELIIWGRYISKAKATLNKKTPLVIAITGSFGKTSVKNILKELLSIKYSVYATPKSFNTQMGICKSIEKLNDEQIFIVEMGARKKGDINKLCDIVDPKIGIVTGVAKQHLKSFKSIENVYKTKKELQECSSVDSMFYNDMNFFGNKMKNEFYKSFGIVDMGSIDLGFDGRYQIFTFIYKSRTYTIKTKLIGKHNIENILLCIKVALYLNVDIEEIIKRIQLIDCIDNRCKISYLDNDVMLIDDSYNANVEGCLKLFDFIQKIDRRKIVLSQGVVELGKDQFVENKNIGLKLAKVADIVVLLGVNKKAIYKGLIEGGFSKEKIIILKHFKQLNNVFKNQIKKGDLVLIQNDLTDNY